MAAALVWLDGARQMSQARGVHYQARHQPKGSITRAVGSDDKLRARVSPWLMGCDLGSLRSRLCARWRHRFYSMSAYDDRAMLHAVRGIPTHWPFRVLEQARPGFIRSPA
jgi:hypothetical protein